MKFDGFLPTVGLALCFALTAQIHARSQLDHKFQHFQRGEALNITSTTIVTTAHNPSHPTVALQAPKYPNITIGQAWVYPSSPFDLGARAMSCECFAPTDACCMSNTVQQLSSQFCMPSNGTCCGNTFCPPKSTCCGDFCCDLGNSCVTSPTAGCCPLGKTCLSTVKCYDHSSKQCTGEIQSPYCCSEEAPFCRTEQSHGLACYASPKVSASTATSTSHTDIGSPQFAPQTTAPLTDTADGMASPIPPGSLIFATLDNGVVGGSSPASSSPTLLLSQQSAAAPTSTPASPARPPSSSSSIPPPQQAETSDTRATPTTTTTTTRGTAAAAAKPARCYDEAVGSAKPCPTIIIDPPTTASTSAAAKAGAAKSTAPPASSAGTHIHLPPFSFSVLRENVKVIGTTVAVTLGVVAALVYMLVEFDVVDDEEENDEEEEEGQTSVGGGGCECQTLRDDNDDGPISVVPGTGRRLSEASRLGREIRRVEGSARVLGEGVWVDKGSGKRDWVVVGGGEKGGVKGRFGDASGLGSSEEGEEERALLEHLIPGEGMGFVVLTLFTRQARLKSFN